MEKRGANITCPRVRETTNGYIENKGVSKRVHDLAFDIEPNCSREHTLGGCRVTVLHAELAQSSN